MTHACPRDGCDKVFTRKANLDGHLNAHDGLQPYQCTLCNARFTRRNEQLAHEREQHSHISARQSFSCHVCGTGFPRKSTLNRHLGIPSGLRRCPKQAIAPVQTVPHTDSTMVPWRSSLTSRVVRPARGIKQHNSNSNDDERQSSRATQHASQGLMRSALYPRAKYLTEYRASTDSFYDWTVVGFKALAGCVDALYALLPSSQADNSVDITSTLIATQYDRIMHSTISLFAKAPLFLTASCIGLLGLLDILRDNDKGEELLIMSGNIVHDYFAQKLGIVQHNPKTVCITELIQVSEKLLQDCSRVFSLQPTSKSIKCRGLLASETVNDVVDMVIVLHVCLVHSVALFFWQMALRAAIGGYHDQADSAWTLYEEFHSLARELIQFQRHFNDDYGYLWVDKYTEVNEPLEKVIERLKLL